MKEALATVAANHDLGALVSLHRRERPLIRYRARMLWILLGGIVAGLVWAAAQDATVFVVVLVLHLAGIAFSGPVAAWALPPDGPAKWMALYERGVVAVTRDDVDRRGREPEHDLVVRVVRFDQIEQVEQHREYAYSTGTQLRAGAAAARIVADRDGKRTVLDLAGTAARTGSWTRSAPTSATGCAPRPWRSCAAPGRPASATSW